MSLKGDAKKDYQRDYMRLKRSNKAPDGGLTQYPAIVYALVDPDKRKKLEKITQSLKNHNVLEEVRYGVVSFDLIEELLEVT